MYRSKLVHFNWCHLNLTYFFSKYLSISPCLPVLTHVQFFFFLYEGMSLSCFLWAIVDWKGWNFLAVFCGSFGDWIYGSSIWLRSVFEVCDGYLWKISLFCVLCLTIVSWFVLYGCVVYKLKCICLLCSAELVYLHWGKFSFTCEMQFFI